MSTLSQIKTIKDSFGPVVKRDHYAARRIGNETPLMINANVKYFHLTECSEIPLSNHIPQNEE